MKSLVCFTLSLLCILSSVPHLTAEGNQTLYFSSEYNGSVYKGSSTEYISYSKKSESEEIIHSALPRYYNAGTNVNTCANVAGAIALGYYDKTFDELIPDFEAVRVIKDKVLYRAQTDAVQDVIDELYDRMDTNGTSAGGTTIAGFKNGLKSYVNSQGRSISYFSTGNNNNFNKQAYLKATREGQPVALFMSGYTLIPISDFSVSQTRDELYKMSYSGNHVLMGYGLKEIKYYNSNGTLKQTLTLLTVATGYNQDPLYYLDLGASGFVDSYAIDIY